MPGPASTTRAPAPAQTTSSHEASGGAEAAVAATPGTPATAFARVAWTWCEHTPGAERAACDILDEYANKTPVFAAIRNMVRNITNVAIDTHPVPGHVCCITSAAGARCRSLVLTYPQGARIHCTLERSLALALWGLAVFERRMGATGDENSFWMGPDPSSTIDVKRMLFAAFTMIDIVGSRGPAQ
jgi:hypothetical protein